MSYLCNAGEFISSEARGARSRDTIVLKALNDGATSLPAGSVIGRITKGATTVAAGGANVGNGAMGAVVEGPGLKLGVYELECIKASTNGGLFNVFDPSGILVGEAVVGVPFSGGGLSFTLSDGPTDFAVGDLIMITVGAGSGQYVALDPAAHDGSEVAAGILIFDENVGGAIDQVAAAIVRDAEVKDALLHFGSATADQVAVAKAQLAGLGIICRPTL